jgi:predicted phosphoribosyltransferase
MSPLFRNRKEAGQLLAGRLSRQGFKQPVVLAGSTSAVPVAFEVALALDAPLHLLLSGEFELSGRTVIVVDDALRPGSSLREALVLLRRRAPRRIVVAVPLAAPEAILELDLLADSVVVLLRPESLGDARPYYADFAAVTDEAAQALLERRR